MINERLSPPEPEEPPVDCWWCHEGIYPDMDNDIIEIGGYACCGDDECVRSIGIEIGADIEYMDMETTDDYRLVDYIRDYYEEYKHIPTEKELEMEKAEAKLDDINYDMR